MNVTSLHEPVDWVLAHPERFFKSGAPSALELAQSVWLDAVLSDARDVLVQHEDAIWVIAASSNWLKAPPLSPPELFVRLVPLAAAGPNSMRSEILVNVFCSEVVAIAEGTVVFTKGAGSAKVTLESAFRRWPMLEAGIAFRFASREVPE